MENAYKDSVEKQNKGGKKLCAMWKVHQAASLASDSTCHKMEREFQDGFSFRSGNTLDCLIAHQYFL